MYSVSYTHTHTHTHTYTHTQQGKTAYDLAMENQNSYGMDTILMGRQKTDPQNMWEYLTRSRVSQSACVQLSANLVLTIMDAGQGF